jgi:hypothetical protein
VAADAGGVVIRDYDGGVITLPRFSRAAWCLALTASLWSCTPEPAPKPATKPRPPPVVAQSGTALERFFPLNDQHVYQYTTESDKGEDSLIIYMERYGATRGGLRMDGATKRFEYVTDGVLLSSASGGAPIYVLKEPLEVGNEWRGEHGGTVSIVAIETEIKVPAGTFQGCVVTVERRQGDRPLEVTTTLCPEVGIVMLDVASDGDAEHARLKSYGPPVDLGPDGVRRLP